MSAQVIELRPGLDKLPPDPNSPRERIKDAVSEVRLTVWEPLQNLLCKSPVMLMRRSRHDAQLTTAFDLGVDFGTHRSSRRRP